MLNQQLHIRTPTVVVLDNRGSTIREINYCRHPDTINKTDERITRHHYHARGYLERSIDARLYKTQQSDSTIQPNIQQTVSLGGLLSATKSVDSGNSVNISDIENRKVMDINGLGLVTEYHYTKPEFVSQLMVIMESSPTSKQILKERFTWGGADNKNIANNSVGKCTHHDFLAGRTEYGAYTLTGQSLIELRFITANTVKTPAHSQYQTRNIYDATGQLLKQIDASGHEREWQYDRAGFLKQSSVQLQSDKKQLVIKAIDYSAAGQKLRVERGNGLVTTYEYEPETQRLLHVKTQRPQGHVLGAKIMQDLRYEYDPVGNIICLKNDAEATRYWRNQKIVPENRYVYDSLYQLVSATGRESANQKTPASMQSQSVTTLVKDAQSYTNYTRLYTYDSGGNLVQLRHLSGIAQQSFTQNISVSKKTNRALLETQQVAIEQIDQQFDALGNQKYLSMGDALQWDLRGTLAQVNKRGNSEHYVYASASQRLIKQQVQILSGRHIITETHYLPNLEIWQSTEGGHLTEHREVVNITGNVRALCWKVGFPKGVKNNQLRYSYDDGVGNSGLETDGQGQLVSYEEYYPYGGTAIWSSENAVEANYKTIRYSGKEKDATGMYYYGYRYYQPWIGRWLSADPAGTVDGLNLYRMVKGNPVSYIDDNGLMFKRLNAIRAGGRERNSSNDISTVSGTFGASESGRQSQLNVSNSKNELIINTIERLVGIVETGRGGMRTLQGEQFNETMTKLAALYIDLQPEGVLSGGSNIMRKSKGFRRPPKDLVNQNKERGNLYDFMTPYLTRDLDSENFCLQNVTSDLYKWTEHIIDKQQKRLPTGKAEELLMRMNKAANPEITQAEFTKNPTSRPPEDQEEAIQFIYYMAGQFESESEWKDFARDMYSDEYPQLKNVTYERAKRVFNKNKSLSVYKVD